MNAIAARALEVTRPSKGHHVFGRAGKFQDALADPAFKGFTFCPNAFLLVGIGRQRWKLLDDEEIQGNSANLLY